MTTTAVINNTSLKSALTALAPLYKEELVENILPFWLTHSLDTENGGFFTCLNRDGSAYDTDKFMWLQGRQVWCFSYMYKNVEARPEWLAMAVNGARFMEEHG